jgi:HK97 family phage prohead protease
MKGMITKTYSWDIKDINEEERTLVAYASTEDEDRDGEILEAAGAALDGYRKNPVVLWAHNHRLPPVAKALWIKQDERGLLFKPQFARTEFADEIFYLYREGFLKAFSVGFIPGEWKRNVLATWELLEVSSVPVPANPEALVQAMRERSVKSEVLVKAFGETLTIDPESEEDEQPEEEKNEEVAATQEEESAEEKLDSLADRVLKIEEKVLQHEQAIVGAGLKPAPTLNGESRTGGTEDDLSEISAEEVASLVAEVTRREIRKAMGKVD